MRQQRDAKLGWREAQCRTLRLHPIIVAGIARLVRGQGGTATADRHRYHGSSHTSSILLRHFVPSAFYKLVQAPLGRPYGHWVQHIFRFTEKEARKNKIMTAI